MASWPAAASLPLLLLSFLATRALDRHMLYWPDVAAWGVALAAHATAIVAQRPGAVGSAALRLGAVEFWRSCRWRLAARGDAGRQPATRHRPTGTVGQQLGGRQLPNQHSGGPARLDPLGRTRGTAGKYRGLHWPLHPAARAYWLVAAVPVALLTYVGALGTGAFAQGVTDPLPYIPLLNPVDLSVALAIGVLLLWRQMLRSAHGVPASAEGLLGEGGLIAGGILAFVAINGVWLRSAHHYLAADWSAYGLWNNSVVQLGLAILWSVLALGLMLFAHRRALRYNWLVGAGLLVVVVINCCSSICRRRKEWERIVTFIAVGLLMLVIGYFVPLPPRGGTVTEATDEIGKDVTP